MGYTIRYHWDVLGTEEVAARGDSRLCSSHWRRIAHPAMQREDVCGERLWLWVRVGSALGRGRRFDWNFWPCPGILCLRICVLVFTHREVGNTGSNGRGRARIGMCHSFR